jgi:hypothetical protein
MYRQTNYPEPQGIPPTKYTIAQVGCFITSFCNLEQRFGKVIDPSGMNAFLRDNSIYIDVDDGVRDDVGWDTVTKYDPNTVVAAIGGATTPPSNNSIVKFVYNNGQSTHFSLVNDVSNGTIIDSWDGVVKSWNVYGGVKAWASYTNKGVNQMTEEQAKELSLYLRLLAFESVDQANANSADDVRQFMSNPGYAAGLAKTLYSTEWQNPAYKAGHYDADTKAQYDKVLQTARPSHRLRHLLLEHI